MTTILAIETSCDETACAILKWDGTSAHVLANVIQSQASLHAQWGGVVPQLAAREHIRNIAPVIEEALGRAAVTPNDIDALAVTQGPGLMPALIVGVNAAKTLSLLWQKPLLGIQHLEGHVYANLLTPGTTLEFPLLALIVSGGHTELVLMRDHFQYEILGETQDDAVGEAFDKAAKLLGLPYPGGPEIAKRADAMRETLAPEKKATLDSLFPRPMLDSGDFNFSFSGLKTAVMYHVKDTPPEKRDENFINEISYAFQVAAVETLVAKTRRALKKYQPKAFVIAGGVSANVWLRERLGTMLHSDFPDTAFLTPEFAYSLDNAAMIGIAAALRYERLSETSRENLIYSENLEPQAQMPLQS